MTDYDYGIAIGQGLIDFFVLFTICFFASCILSTFLVAFDVPIKAVERICDIAVVTCFITLTCVFVFLA